MLAVILQILGALGSTIAAALGLGRAAAVLIGSAWLFAAGYDREHRGR